MEDGRKIWTINLKSFEIITNVTGIIYEQYEL